MKNSKFAKLITLMLSLALMIGATAAVSVMAEEADPPQGTVTNLPDDTNVGIASLNLSYDIQTEMLFAVYDGNGVSAVAEGVERTVYLLFFNSDPGDANGETLYNNAVARKTAAGKKSIGGVDHLVFYSNGINARDLTKDFYVCPVVVERDGIGNTTYARGYTMKESSGSLVYTPRACSVVSYARQMIVDGSYTGELTSAQLTLFGNMLRYADVAARKDGVTLPEREKYLIVTGGSIGFGDDGLNSYRLNVTSEPAAATVDLRAEAKNADGFYFVCWQDIYGNTVSTDRFVYDLPVHNDLGITAYRAIYGSADDSAYAGTVDFESIVDKDSNGIIADAIAPSGTETYTDAREVLAGVEFNNRAYWNGSECVSQQIIKLLKNSTEDARVSIQKVGTSAALTQTVNNTALTNAMSFEVDLKVVELVSAGNVFSLDIAGDNFDFKLAIYVTAGGNETDGYDIQFGGGVGNYTYWKNKSGSALPTKNAAQSEKTHLDTFGEIITLKCEVDNSSTVPMLNVYINNTLVSSLSGASTSVTPKGFFASHNGKGTNIESVGISYYSHTVATIEFDNFTFFADND